MIGLVPHIGSDSFNTMGRSFHSQRRTFHRSFTPMVVFFLSLFVIIRRELSDSDFERLFFKDSFLDDPWKNCIV